MDTIKFVIEDHGDEEFGYKFKIINIYINEQDLIDLVTRVERKEWDGQKNSRSGYIGFPLTDFERFHREMLGNKVYRRSILLTCTCTFEECNCIMANITFEDRSVTWSDLRSPYLGGQTYSPFVEEADAIEEGWVPIDYSGLSPFVFEKEQYLSALEQVVEECRLRKLQEPPSDTARNSPFGLLGLFNEEVTE